MKNLKHHKNPKVSIITVSFNSAETISETIDSVLSQDYSNIEYIIIDGLSSDNTLGIVKSYGDRISRFISEKDKGLYDAMNKGIEMATGEIIGILNSDDVYYSQNIISTVVNQMQSKRVDILYGDLIYFRSKDPNKVVRYYKGKEFSKNKVAKGWVPPHPTFFIKKKIYQKFGNFDTSFKLSADFDLIVRFLGLHAVSYYYLPQILVKMRLGGESTKSIKNIIDMNRDNLISCSRNNIETNFLKFHFKYLSKTMAYIKNIF